jgi:hypothetical protein
MRELKPDDYLFLSLAEATAPTKGGFFQHYLNGWWVVHPDKGLAFYNPKHVRTGRRQLGRWGSPQCNTDERISREVGMDCASSLWPEIEVRLIPSVWVPIDLRDYRD